MRNLRKLRSAGQRSPNPRPLQLSSESKTGIKIPSGQIAGGKFVVAAGESKDLDLDFNACRSIVHEGNGSFRLKPVLHAGEVAQQAAISGTVIDAGTQAAIVGGNTVVALEQNDGNGVDRVIMETVTDANGAFSFCPVASGTYDIVVAAINGAGVAYAATVITGVQSSAALGQVPLTAGSRAGFYHGDDHDQHRQRRDFSGSYPVCAGEHHGER